MASNFKDFKIKEFKPKIYESKTSNSNNSLCPDPRENIKTSNKARKEKKKPQRQNKCNKKDSNSDIASSEVNTTNNFSEKVHVQTDQSQVTCWNCNKKSTI